MKNKLLKYVIAASPLFYELNDGGFYPLDNVSRAQMAAMTNRASADLEIIPLKNKSRVCYSRPDVLKHPIEQPPSGALYL